MRSVSGGRRGVSRCLRQNLFFLQLIFQVSVDELLGETGKEKTASAGPTGGMRRLFEKAALSLRQDLLVSLLFLQRRDSIRSHSIAG